MTPAADVSGVLSMGVVQVASDPRMQLADSLQALLTAELVDNDSWELLCQLARGLGQEELANELEIARAEEATHLVSVRTWLTSVVMREAGAEPEATLPAS
jgi:hypothetical protein